MEGVPDSHPVVTVSVQFPDLSVAEFDDVRARLTAGRPGRVVVPHEAHRWYAASSDPETVRALVSALRAAVEGRRLSFDDEEALDDLGQEYADWLEESEDRDDAEPGPVMSFSVHLPALERDEFTALADALRAAHSRRIVLGEQQGLSHHELSERSRIAARVPGIRAALRGEPIGAVDALPLVALLHDYAAWLSANPAE
ncbi:Transcriptional regulator [Tsukamurella ocularis]